MVTGPDTQDRRVLANAQRAMPAAPPAARRTMPRINLSIMLGPMVRFEVQGESCAEIADALDGFERLNQMVDEMFTDLASRVYPGGDAPNEATPEAPR